MYSAKVISLQLKEVERNPCFSTGPVGEDLYHWEAIITGSKGSPYENGVFKLDIHFPLDYPFAPPRVMFKTKVYHPNVNTYGNIFLKMQRTLFVEEIARIYVENRAAFETTALAWTVEHAGGA
ncbi:hypothetical protein EUTSA_v10012195mg [Eutrema salsugineum]|uniref:UBC core domain-containing protein n=1 Tax=Eutrema salsugineum TaxID=72664 RepID=V4MHC7_EUTSA|nr:hypothetical protein EUTSA_v10012195mg [Eutrema salsugineum]